MCTLVVAAHVVPGSPLLVVANRDEQRGRASSPPLRWPGGFVAPRDEVAGGTWLGLNDAGVFVAITNRYLGPRDATRTSRGALVVEALRGRSARDVHDAMGRVDPARYNGFHLVYADATDVLATISDGTDLAQLTLGSGLSIVTERSFGAAARDAEGARRVERIRAAFGRLVTEPFEPERVTTLLAEHDDADPLAATCIHLDALGYGTRSAMVLTLPDGPGAAAMARGARMFWAEGPPCTTPFAEIDLPTVARADAAKTG